MQSKKMQRSETPRTMPPGKLLSFEEFGKQSQVVQRFLPRPTSVNADAVMEVLSAVDPTERSVQAEMMHLIAHDVSTFGGRVSSPVPPMEKLGEETLLRAQRELNKDWATLRGAPKLPRSDDHEEDQLVVAALQEMKEMVVQSAQYGRKMEKKLALHLGGYQNRDKMLRQKIVNAAEALDTTTREINSARAMEMAEESAILRRLERLRDQMARGSRQEREAQEQYRLTRDRVESLR